MGGSSPRAFSLTGDHSTGELLAVAKLAAASGAAEVLRRVGNHGEVRTKSSLTDPVTEADEAAERAIRAVITEARPGDAIVGEEGGDVEGDSGLRWLVDPLDGTVNFLYGMPQWSVSVAVADAVGPLVGVVLHPASGEEFSAVRGEQPHLNGSPFARQGLHSLSPDAADPLEGVMLATGFNYEREVRVLQGKVFESLVPRVRDIRRSGSAALDLCWTAIGRVDAYAEHGVRAWDVSAGALVCTCAGLDVLTLASGRGWPTGIVAAERQVAAALARAFGAESADWPATWIS